MHSQHCQVDSLARFHRPLLFSFTLLVLQPAAAGKHQNEPNTKGSLSTSVTQLSLFPLFVCLPPTFTQHEHESFPCLQLSTMLHLWAPSHTANTAERNFSLLSGSFIISNTGSLLSHSSCLHLSLPHQRNLRLSLRIGDPTQHPRGSDFIGRQLLQSRPQEQSVGGEANYLRHRVWDTSVRPLEDIAHLGVSSRHLIFQNVHLWISFVSTISCRNVHLCCLGNEVVGLFKAAIDKATKVLTNWLCFPQPLSQYTS